MHVQLSKLFGCAGIWAGSIHAYLHVQLSKVLEAYRHVGVDACMHICAVVWTALV